MRRTLAGTATRLLLPLAALNLVAEETRSQPTQAVRLRGEVVDADTGKPIPARVYIQGEKGAWFFPRSEAENGSAFTYRKQRNDVPRCVEMHTTLSAHPFVVDLPPGKYTLTV